jgi:REP element-mobilizing transposase RayT
MSRPRQVLEGSTYLVTRRCSERRFFLRPGDVTDAIMLFCLASAALKNEVQIHAFCVMSNHYHLVVTDPYGRLPAFMRDLDGLSARALNAALGRSGPVWEADKYSAVRLMAEADVLGKIAYTLVNPVAAGLVRQAERWPGLKSLVCDLGGGELVARRPEGFFRKKGPMPEECRLKLVLPAGFESREAFVSAVASAVRAAEDAAVAKVEASERTFMGEEAVRRQSPLERPSTEEARGGLNPRVASRDRKKRIEAVLQIRAFVDAYRVAWSAFKAGVRDAVFPAGTYGPRVSHGVLCAAP